MHSTSKNQGKIIGVSAPIFALRTHDSHEWGDFSALKDFARWAVKCGFKVIQILPIYDTGEDPSPYMLRSTMALNPIYMTIREILEYENSRKSLKMSLKNYDALIQKIPKPYQYADILSAKMLFLHTIYQNAQVWDEDQILRDWISENLWIKIYAVFCFLESKHDNLKWQKWEKWSNPSSQDIEQLWQTHYQECLFYAWIQYHLDRQLCDVTSFLRNLGISLKGDLPIMVGQDSVDVWYYRDYFHLNEESGVPPDQFNPEGQKWQFPTYNWDMQEKDHFEWLKRRLESMSRYFDFIRIDHVIGYFRTWIIPRGISDALCGYFRPSTPITKQELLDAQFSEKEIAWLSKAHISKNEFLGNIGNQAAAVENFFEPLDEGALLRMKMNVFVKEATAQTLDASVEKYLSHIAANCTLLDLDGLFYPRFAYAQTSAYQSLSQQQQSALNHLVQKKNHHNASLEHKQGKKILEILVSTTSATLCAENLGVLPDSLNRTLDNLGILHLSVARWMSDLNNSSQLLSPTYYPENSVATLSTHDSTVMREWWESDPNQARMFLRALNLQEEMADEPYTAQVAMTILHTFIKNVQSRLTILPLQDYLALSDHYRTNDPNEERINSPGLCHSSNWHYRMKPSLEDLVLDKRFIFLIRVTNTIL